MNSVRLFFIAVTIVITIGPIGTALFIYRDDLTALVMPRIPELTAEMPTIEYVGYRHDPSLRILLFRFNVTNPYNFGLKLNVFSANVSCSEHGVLLGRVSLMNSPQIVPPKSYTIIDIAMTYTSDGENHINVNHAGETSIYVNLENLTVDIQGVNVQISNLGPIPITEEGGE